MKFHYISFVDIALPDSSVDAIVAARCFHWFANEEAVRDICRVLVPGGSLGMIWILPDESVPWVKELLTFFRPLENGFEHTTSEETMKKIFQMVGLNCSLSKRIRQQGNTGSLLMMNVTIPWLLKVFCKAALMRSKMDSRFGLIKSCASIFLISKKTTESLVRRSR